MSTLLRQLKGESQRYTKVGSYGLGKLLDSAADRIAELEKEAVISMKEHHDLCWKIEELKQAIISNCYDDPSTSGKRLMSLALKEREL
jgi:predicted small metal-binding protein